MTEPSVMACSGCAQPLHQVRSLVSCSTPGCGGNLYEAYGWDKPSETTVRLNEQIEAVTEFREAVNALVQSLMADGFSEDQARDIVTGFWRVTGRGHDA